MLSFKQVEAVFLERFGISEDRAGAFRSRLQHLQRLGFPEGVNTGRGKRAAYEWRHVIQLMVGLDLIDLGLTPDAAVHLVKRNTPKLTEAVHAIVAGFETEIELTKAIKKARCPYGLRRIVVASFAAFTVSQGDGTPPGYLLVYDHPGFAAKLLEDPALEPAAAYLDLGSRLMLIAHVIADTAQGGDWKLTASGLMRWAENWSVLNSERPE